MKMWFIRFISCGFPVVQGACDLVLDNSTCTVGSLCDPTKPTIHSQNPRFALLQPLRVCVLLISWVSCKYDILVSELLAALIQGYHTATVQVAIITDRMRGTDPCRDII